METTEAELSKNIACDISKNIACIDNVLINASYNLELTEHRLILAAIGFIKPELRGKKAQAGEEVTPEKIYYISIKDYAELFDITPENARKLLKEAVENLMIKRIITFRHEKVTIKTLWVQEIVFLPDKDKIGIRFSQRVCKFLSKLHSNFTQLRLKDVKKFQSTYSLRLFELLQMQKGVQRGKFPLVFDLEYLYFKLCVPPSRKDFRFFNQKILMNSLKEIKEVKGWENLSIDYVKKGKKVEGLSFFQEKIA